MKKSIAIVKPLSEVLQYENQNVIDRFLKYYDVSMDEALFIFEELKKWLWLCGKSFEDGFKGAYISKDLAIIDEMWHTFLMFSLDYYNFCTKYFNVIIHHIPETKSERKELNLPEVEEESEENKINALKEKETQFLKYVNDNLGSETLNIWFLDFPQKYYKEKLNKIHKGLYPNIKQ